MKKRRKLIIDSTKGGNGDIWMRLISFYIVAGILTDYELCLIIPSFFQKLADATFGDRLFILNKKDEIKPDLIYNNLGIIDLLQDIAKGKRFISPYQRAVINDRKVKKPKDYVNICLFSILDFFGKVQVPAWKWIKSYQGYLDIIAIKQLRCISYEQYLSQMESDGELIFNKLNGIIPVSPQLQIPDDLNDNILIYPTGTSRQFIPVWWAKSNLPLAYYAFFYKDKDAEEFKIAGLKTVFFYEEPGDIITLARQAKWTISTDSFPSHLLQFSIKKCSITITEVLISRIIAPFFKGKVIDAEVNCHPCIHLDRNNHPLCAAGYIECQNWKSTKYTQNIINSIA